MTFRKENLKSLKVIAAIIGFMMLMASLFPVDKKTVEISKVSLTRDLRTSSIEKEY